MAHGMDEGTPDPESREPDPSLPFIELGMTELRGSPHPYDIATGRLIQLTRVVHTIEVNNVETLDFRAFVYRGNGDIRVSWGQREEETPDGK